MKSMTGRDPGEPEIQRLPPRTELGREIRKALAPEPVHVEVDYASLELRLMAELTKEHHGDD